MTSVRFARQIMWAEIGEPPVFQLRSTGAVCRGGCHRRQVFTEAFYCGRVRRSYGGLCSRRPSAWSGIVPRITATTAKLRPKARTTTARILPWRWSARSCVAPTTWCENSVISRWHCPYPTLGGSRLKVAGRHTAGRSADQCQRCPRLRDGACIDAEQNSQNRGFADRISMSWLAAVAVLTRQGKPLRGQDVRVF